MTRVDGYCTIGLPGDEEPSPQDLLCRMDHCRVDRAVIAPPSRCLAWANDAGNDAVLSAAATHPDRLIPAVSVNPWRPDAAEAVIGCVRRGGRILVFDPAVQGFNPCEGEVDGILRGLRDAGLTVPVYVHTGQHSFGSPSQLALLARRFPQVKFIMGHAGATDYSTDVAGVCGLAGNVLVESSCARPPGFVQRAAAVGFHRAIMGSGHPYNDMDYEWSCMERLLPAEHRLAVLGGNLLGLLEGRP
jgi:hypothetical protein